MPDASLRNRSMRFKPLLSGSYFRRDASNITSQIDHERLKKATSKLRLENIMRFKFYSKQFYSNWKGGGIADKLHSVIGTVRSDPGRPDAAGRGDVHR